MTSGFITSVYRKEFLEMLLRFKGPAFSIPLLFATIIFVYFSQSQTLGGEKILLED